MKRVVIVGMIVMGLVVMAYAGDGFRLNTAPNKERAVVEFTQQVKLLGVFLKGNYVVIHDDERMAQGEPCLYVYRLEGGNPGKLIVSFHCEPVARPASDNFTVLISRRTSIYDIPEVQEIQFPGSAKAHKVPAVN
jgi:hypothetical protein